MLQGFAYLTSSPKSFISDLRFFTISLASSFADQLDFDQAFFQRIINFD